MESQQKEHGKPVTRRDFLKGIGGGTVGAAIVPEVFSQEAASIQTKQGPVPLYAAKRVTISVNEKKHTIQVAPDETLLSVLRERLNLTGAKRICNQGECGSCTVLLDGRPIYSCLFPAFRADGKEITTVENLAEGEKLHPLQKSFIENDAYQCGFCTPGFIMSSLAFLKTNSNPSLDEIKEALSGNICRCGNYQNIFKALSEAAKKMKGA